MKSKYIIIESDGIEVPLIFSRFLLHEDILAVVGKNAVLAAGFCELNGSGNWIVGGQSVSLELCTRPQDAEILNEHTGANSFLCQPDGKADIKRKSQCKN
jgi:hypothetical protein